MNRSDTLGALAAALSAAQAELRPAAMNATNPFLKSKYADLGSVIDAARPVLAKNGLSYSQLPIGDGQTIGVETILMHSSGEWVASQISLAAMEERGKSAAQVAGSIITYLRRYALAAALGIYADEDTDGHMPQPAPRPAPTHEAQRPGDVDGGDPMSTKTRGQLFALLTERGITDPEIQRTGIGRIIGRPITSRSELTEAEARAVIASLRTHERTTDA